MRSFLLGLRIKYIPVGSRRERIYHLARLMIFRWKRNGFISALITVSQRARFYLSKELSFSSRGYTYQQWIFDHEPNKEVLLKQRTASEKLSGKPTISIITPVFNPDAHVMRDTINSVLAQTYPYWELCLADGASTQDGVVDTLDEFAAKDPRISVKHLSENLGISGNSNAALSMATGDFIALMDHDDLLAPDMLYEVVQVINQKPDVEIIYFDEDKITADGSKRLDPFFKPSAWSPDLLLSTNYLMHSVISHALVDQHGGFRSEVDGAQDWDLSLRITKKKRNIHHIPKVFYHWRQVPGSAAREANAKPWAFAAQARCIEDHLHALGETDARVDFPGLGRVHVSWGPSKSKVSIIIPNRDNVDLLTACIHSILEKTKYEYYEILIVDTGSKDKATLDFYDQITKNARVSLYLYPHRFNYHKVNNFGAELASGELLLFLNNDTEVINSGWLEEFSTWAERPGVGVVGTKLLYPDGNIQHAGIVMGVEGHGSHIFEKLPEHHYGPFGSPDWYRDYHAVTGACMMIPKKVFTELGGFDENYEIGYGDIDICLRAGEAGYRVVYTPFAEMVHHEGGTRGFSLPPNDVLRASYRMYEQIRDGDDYFNPNLSYLSRQPSVANPREPDRGDRILKILHLFGQVDTTALEMNPDIGKSFVQDPVNIQPEAAPGKKILMVSHEMSLTGAPLILSDLARYLAGQGYSITVLSPTKGKLEQAFWDLGAEVIINPLVLRDARELLRYIESCDLLVANTILSWRAIYAAKAVNKPCIWWVHESQFGLEYSSQYPSVPGAFQAADVMAFPTQATADLYTEFTLKERIQILRSGLDTDKLEPVSDDKQSDNNGKLTLVNVASYEPRKGQDILVKSLNQLSSEIEVECYLIGRKLDWWFSQKLSFSSRNKKNIHVLGELPNREVLSRIQEADVFILPSRDEALPMTLLEAMYFSKAIIASRSGGIPEIIEHGVNGLIFDIDNDRQLAGYIKELYNNRPYLEELGRKGNEKLFSKLTFRVQGKKWEEIIESLLRGQNSNLESKEKVTHANNKIH
jgi:glycosyltransferase involved in cell wall biosynthesis